MRNVVTTPDLVLINTPNLNGINTMRLGLLSIASFVRSQGFGVKIIDGTAASIKKQVMDLDLDDAVVGLTATTDVVLVAYRLCEFIKERYPRACCVLGGFHATALPEQTLEESRFDLVVFGEGELTIADIMKARRKKAGFDGIPGVVFKKDGSIVKNNPRELIRDLDILPMPAYDLVDINRHFGGTRYEKNIVKKCLLLLVSRGCPYDCVFCSSKKMWKRKLRWHSVEYIVNLIKYGVDNFNIDSVEFLDDELLCSKERIALLTERLIAEGLADKIKWECQARVTSVDEEKLRMLKNAGCQLIRFGIESGSPRSLGFLKRGTVTVEDAFNAIGLCQKIGLPTFGTFIIGAPDESIDDILKTINFIEKSGLSHAEVFVATPYPGTDFFDLCEERKYFIDDITWFDFLIEGKDPRTIIRNDNFTAQQLRHIRNYIKFNVVKPLNMGKRSLGLNHRMEIEKILKGDLSRTKEGGFAVINDYWRKTLRRPDKIIPFIIKKILRRLESIYEKNYEIRE